MTTGGESGQQRRNGASRADRMGTAFDRTLVSEAMKQMSPSHRAVIREAYYRGRMTGYIAAERNVSDAVVKDELHTALSALHLTLLAMAEQRGAPQHE